jgi:hypothetical protein
MNPTVRVADTETLIALNQESVDHGHFWVLSEDIIKRLDPNGLHICWGTYPHEQNTSIVRVGGGGKLASLPEQIELRNGHPGAPAVGDEHLRTIWLLSVVDGDPEEAGFHLTHHRLLSELPEYSRPPDSEYPRD